MIKQKVSDLLLQKIGKPVTLLTPKDMSFGDYAVNLYQIDKSNVKSQMSKVIDILSKSELFEKVEPVGSFINLTMSRDILFNELDSILEQKEQYGTNKSKSPKRINLEYGQPNTHKLPHIGHLFSYIYGECLARLLESTGNKVFRTNYQGDVGPHVAKCLYIVKRSFDSVYSERSRTAQDKLQSKVKSLKTLEEKVFFLQTCYQEGSKAYEDDPKAKEQIDDLNKKIYQGDPEVNKLWLETRQWSLDYYGQFEDRLGIHYDKHYFESITGPLGKDLATKHIGDVFEKSEGAVVFRGEKYNLHTRVFITKSGNPTYEAKDIGTEYLKYKDWPFDKAIITTASEQNGYFKVVIEAINETLPELKGKVFHLGFGMIDLKAGKMSSRTGNILSAIDLVTLVEKEVEKLSSDKKSVVPVSLAAIKYSFLKSEARKNISFDLKESISTHGNSGPYLLYAYARCMSILKKVPSPVIANGVKQSQEVNVEIAALSSVARNDDMSPEELSLLRTFFRYPEVVEAAATNYAPHLVATYLFDLTQKFNVFYENCPILKAEKETLAFRLQLTKATAQLIKNGLYLLGIDVLDKI